MSAWPRCRMVNRRAVRLDDVPTVADGPFRAAVIDAVADGWRIVSLFGTPEDDASLRLIAVLGDDGRGELAALSTVVSDRYGSAIAWTL